MEIYPITHEYFKKYGKVIKDIDFVELIQKMQEIPVTQDVVYVPSAAELESLEVFDQLQVAAYGEMPIQIGYCNGNNYMLNALEYHRSSEINVAATDAILLLGSQQDITEDLTYDTSKVEAFLLPKGCAVEIYATTLHYAPCNAGEEGFRVVIILPKGTNYPLEKTHTEGEDCYLAATNKWLLGHADGGQLPEGMPVGLVGENICIK
ncbi:MAG: DUF4867 family protein [Cellulosilyticaceae bacterium]